MRVSREIFETATAGGEFCRQLCCAVMMAAGGAFQIPVSETSVGGGGLRLHGPGGLVRSADMCVGFGRWRGRQKFATASYIALHQGNSFSSYSILNFSVQLATASKSVLKRTVEILPNATLPERSFVVSFSKFHEHDTHDLLPTC